MTQKHKFSIGERVRIISLPQLEQNRSLDLIGQEGRVIAYEGAEKFAVGRRLLIQLDNKLPFLHDGWQNVPERERLRNSCWYLHPEDLQCTETDYLPIWSENNGTIKD